MKLKKLSINNLRGLTKINFDVENFTTLIGKNNCGKSSILRAIELVCSGETPELEEFHLRGCDKIEIDATFGDLQEWERNTSGISSHIYNNELRLLYATELAESEEGKKKPTKVVYRSYKVDEQIEGWSDVLKDADERIQNIAKDELGLNGTSYKQAGNKEQVKQLIRERFPEMVTVGDAKWSDEGFSINAALQQALPKIILIPAVKDATDDQKFSKTGKSGFNELMRNLVLPQIKGGEQYKELLRAADALVALIKSDEGAPEIAAVNRKLSERLTRLIDAKAMIRLENPEMETFISSGVGIRIYDGEHDTPIALQGHGLQRTLIFSLLELAVESGFAPDATDKRTTMVLYEEPELYLHPQMLRKLKAILAGIADNDCWQIVCSTHSPVFINIADKPKSLIILNRNDSKRIQAKQLIKDPFEDSEEGRIERNALRAALDFHPTVCEVFFAEHSVLVEGDTEMALFKHCPELLEYCGISEDHSLECSIVSCGGKWTIPAIARLMKAFHIPFKVVHDRDAKGLSIEELDAKRAIHPYKANRRIADIVEEGEIWVNDDTIEDLWNGKGDTEFGKPYGAIVRVGQLIEEKAVPQDLVDLVKFVFTRQEVSVAKKELTIA